MQDALTVAEELIDLTTTLATERRLEALLSAVVSSARRLTRAESGQILVLDRTGQHLHAVVAQNDAAPAHASVEAIPVYARGNTYNLSEASVFCAVTGKIVNLPDITSSTTFNFAALHEHDQRIGYRTKSFVAAPLWSTEGATLGVLQLANMRLTEDGQIGGLPPAFERLVASFAAHAAVAIGNARLFEENRQLIRQLDRQNAELAEENTRLKVIARTGDLDIIGESPPFQAALDLARRAATSSVAVLLLGETGTGKDVFAQAIHRFGKRRDKPFVAQNCAALPETLLESELFGHRRGAYSGAIADRKGLVHEANGGTLFLDEIGDMPMSLQAKILRLLEEGSVRRLGDNRSEKVDVRVIAATNADLPRKIAQGSFREDLFYRLSVFPINLPALRERPSDIPKLLDFFLAKIARTYGRSVATLTPHAMEALIRWRFAGNVRELKNVVERAALLIDGDERIDLKHLPPEIGATPKDIVTALLPNAMNGSGLRSVMRQYEAILIETRLRETGWNQSRAANLLQISRRSLVDKLQRYAIRPPV